MTDPGIELLRRYVSGQTNQKESNLVETWLDANDLTPSDLRDFVQVPEGVRVMLRQDADASWNELRRKMRESKPRRLVIAPWKLAASLLLLATAAVFFVVRSNQPPKITAQVVTNTTDSVLRHSLPDGTVLYLNKNATVSYRPGFAAQRALSLRGQVFFDVKRDVSHPFQVTAGETVVTVLGTSFDVRDDPNETTVVVASGKVSVRRQGQEEVLLAAGDRSSWNKQTGALLVGRNDDINFESWRTGLLRFEQATLQEAALILSRHFGLRVRLDTDDRDLTYTSRFRQATLDDVLSEMEDVLGITTRRDSTSVIISAR